MQNEFKPVIVIITPDNSSNSQSFYCSSKEDLKNIMVKIINQIKASVDSGNPEKLDFDAESIKLLPESLKLDAQRKLRQYEQGLLHYNESLEVVKDINLALENDGDLIDLIDDYCDFIGVRQGVVQIVDALDPTNDELRTLFGW